MIVASPNFILKDFNSSPCIILTPIIILRLIVLGKPSKFLSIRASTSSTNPALAEPYTIQSAVLVRPLNLARANTIVDSALPTRTSMLLSFGNKTGTEKKEESMPNEEWTAVDLGEAEVGTEVGTGTGTGTDSGANPVPKTEDESQQNSSKQEDKNGGDNASVNAGEVRIDINQERVEDPVPQDSPADASISQAILIRRDTVRTISRNSMSGRNHNPTLVVHLSSENNAGIKRSLTLPNLIRSNSKSRRARVLMRQDGAHDLDNGLKRVKSLPKISRKVETGQDLFTTNGNNSD